MANTERVESRFYSRDGDSYVCGLCPHGCRLRPGQYGRCGSRRADEDMLVAYSYGKVSSIAVDPIEKKPLYHYRPRSRCFSVGSVGCNMRCRHCQNYSISMMSYGKKRTTYESPEELVAMCRHEGLDTIAFTYNEPGIWFEYIMDVMRADPDLHLVLVTNGFLNEEPLRQLCGVADAINLDVKGFTEDFYGKICEGRLADVMRSARIIRDEGVHLEITYLVIPGHNDSEDEVGSFCGWVRDELGADVPVHFTRFHPDFEMMDVPILGMVENMSYLVCPDCGKKISLFGEGRAEELCKKYSIPTLAKMPLDASVAQLADKGEIAAADTDALAEVFLAVENAREIKDYMTE